MQKKTYTVSIVIPNWNGAHLLKKNLPSVLAAAHGAQVIVADDASTDDSVSYLASAYPHVQVIANPKQLGFAGNVNSGVAAATGDIVVLLNTDVRPEPDFLTPLLKRFAVGAVAAVGCLEKSHETDGTVLRGRGIAKWEKGFFIHSRGEVNSEDTAWVSGGSSAYRRNVWEQLGGLDTLYNPFYWEDIDFSYQLLKSGFRIVFEPKSIVGHFHEEGKIKTSYTPSDVKKIVYRNQFIFLWKNISDVPLFAAHMFWLPIRLIQAIYRRDWLMIQGFSMAVGTLPAILQSHKRASRHWRLKDTAIFTT